MSQIEIKHIEQNYKKLGDLTDKEFLSAKSISQRIFYSNNIDLEHIRLIKADGEILVSIDKIAIGDTVKIQGTIRNMAGNKEQTGVVAIPNVTDVRYNAGNGEFLIANAENCVTNIDCKREMLELSAVINDASNWVTQNELNALIGQATLSDFIAVRDGNERTRDVKFDDFSLVEEFANVPKQLNKDPEIHTPTLLF